MTKKDLAQFLAKRSGLAASICEALLTEAVAGIVEALSQGGAVNLEGLGTLRLDKFPDERGNRLRFDPAPEVAEFLKAGYAKVGHTEVLVGQHTPFTSAPTAIVPAVPKPAGGDEPGEPAEPIDPSKAAEELESLFSTEKDHSANPYLDPDEPPKAPVLAGAQAQAQGNKEEAKPAEADEETNLSSFAADILELGAQELARGLGLAAESNPRRPGPPPHLPPSRSAPRPRKPAPAAGAPPTATNAAASRN
ncbi:MAG: HU family DNA-binding protein [Planctomycetota bacterium]|nr:HU family DNA-binding protein [Planctomycetota bacterium]